MGERCEEIGGTGKCSRCDGSGREEHGLFGLDLIEEYCVKCQGSGRCNTCDGSGHEEHSLFGLNGSRLDRPSGQNSPHTHG